MKKFTELVAVLSVLFGVVVFASTKAQAQTYRTDGGLIVVEDSLLSPNYKRIVFVVAKEISMPARVEFQTISSEGIVNRFSPQEFPLGLRKGQVINVWNGELNNFHATPWLYFDVTIFTSSETYYSRIMTPVNYREQYKEPMITSISETGGYGVPYVITTKGIYDTTIPSLVLINTNVFVSPKTVTQTAPGIIKFTMPSGNFELFPSGKYLLTICQAGHCDTLQGRHR